MAEQIQVRGPAIIKVGTGDAGALETLGYVENQAEAEVQPYFADIYGDQHGGQSGPPIDIQFFGAIARGQLVFSRYDSAVLAKLEPFVLGGTAGTIAAADIGKLMIQGGYYTRLLFHTTSGPLNFPITIFRQPIRIPLGTQASIVSIGWEAHRNQSSGVLYDSTAPS